AVAVEDAAKAGIVVIAAAGNQGCIKDPSTGVCNPVAGGIISPGFTPSAITVGAMNTKGTVNRGDDVMATFSSHGPVRDPNCQDFTPACEAKWITKPDLVAPGTEIVSTAAPG